LGPDTEQRHSEPETSPPRVHSIEARVN
jgi:hypothetical protein